MGYLRLFIELRRENTGESCGQARIELQDRPGRIDCKVRCALMGLPEGDVYEAALVSEYAGRYQEYPLGSFVVNVRGQAGLMFRGSFSADNAGDLGVGGFKAIIARGGGKRVVGYRWEPILIPDSYEEPVRPSEPEPEPAFEGVAAELEQEAVPEPEVVETAAEETAQIEEPVMEEAMIEEVEVPIKETAVQGFQPQAVYVMRELLQVEAVCGEAGKRAFERYHHLVLMQQDEKSFLGMPCRYRSGQQQELADEGYVEFYTPHGGAPTYGEFGYWVKPL